MKFVGASLFARSRASDPTRERSRTFLFRMRPLCSAVQRKGPRGTGPRGEQTGHPRQPVAILNSISPYAYLAFQTRIDHYAKSRATIMCPMSWNPASGAGRAEAVCGPLREVSSVAGCMRCLALFARLSTSTLHLFAAQDAEDALFGYLSCGVLLPVLVQLFWMVVVVSQCLLLFTRCLLEWLSTYPSRERRRKDNTTCADKRIVECMQLRVRGKAF